ncbi:MAG: 4-hydroxythreonine-4-phosphate dehydrogenase PdxA [Deltaproteobacteria bacterium]|nr:4-hydroxythreonine-4-phosphate dehydrogenase PdxA [Deltaproteobacteria bacterium]
MSASSKQGLRKPSIGITMGDPVGIGPEIIVQALEQEIVWEVCTPFVLGDIGIMKRAAELLHHQKPLQACHAGGEFDSRNEGINVVSLSHLDTDHIYYGKPNQQTGEAMVAYIREGIRLSLEGAIDALVTCPINKAAMALAGCRYPGHTELLAHETHAADYAMMLAGEKLRVVLVTTHHALREVPDLLTEERILSTIRLTYQGLKKFFGISKPKLAVAALNPHAGEGGMFGKEEETIINPGISKAREEGIDVRGPFPSDALFFFAAKGDFDAVVCMFHDQGLIPLKLLHFDDAVNITLGLPIIRTSVDHGTAYDIAGTGRANAKSLANAITMAAHMALWGGKKDFGGGG